jgi:hypothetical protein
MHVPRRWTIYECPNCGDTGLGNSMRRCGCDGPEEQIEVVEVDPSTTRGAVDLSEDVMQAAWKAANAATGAHYPDEWDTDNLRAAVRYVLDTYPGGTHA